MPRPTKGARLGSNPTHQKMLLGGMAAALIMEERIRTTETKAKRLRPVAERLITLSKAGDVHARRQALSLIEDRDVIHKLFSDLGPRFAERNGGYTRILKLGPRKGDAAPMAIIELVDGPAARPAGSEPEEVKRRRFGRRKKAATDKTAKTGAPVQDTVQDAADEDLDEDVTGQAAPESLEDPQPPTEATRSDEQVEDQEAQAAPNDADAPGEERPGSGN